MKSLYESLLDDELDDKIDDLAYQHRILSKIDNPSTYMEAMDILRKDIGQGKKKNLVSQSYMKKNSIKNYIVMYDQKLPYGTSEHVCRILMGYGNGKFLCANLNYVKRDNYIYSYFGKRELILNDLLPSTYIFKDLNITDYAAYVLPDKYIFLIEHIRNKSK